MKRLNKILLSSITFILFMSMFTCSLFAEEAEAGQESVTNLWPLIIIFAAIGVVELVIIGIETYNIEVVFDKRKSTKNYSLLPLFLLAVVPDYGLLLLYIEVAVDILFLIEILLLLGVCLKKKKRTQQSSGKPRPPLTVKLEDEVVQSFATSIESLVNEVTTLKEQLNNLKLGNVVVEKVSSVSTDNVQNEVEFETESKNENDNGEQEDNAGLYYNEDGTVKYDTEYPEFFEKMIQDLTDEEKNNFKKVVADGSIRSSIRRPMIENYTDESHFLIHLFSSTTFRSMLTIHTYEVFKELLLKYLRTDYETAMLDQKMVNIYYLHRNDDENAIEKCKEYALKDVNHQLNVLKIKNDKLPSLKKLITIYTQEGDYDQAIKYCNIAIEHSLIDFKDAGYENRKADLEAKKAKEEAKALKALERKKHKKRKTTSKSA